VAARDRLYALGRSFIMYTVRPEFDGDYILPHLLRRFIKF